MALPPFGGAVHERETCVFPGVAARPEGAEGTVAGVTALDEAEAGPVPTALVAVTVNVYDVPFVSPVIVIGLPVEVAEWPPPSLAV
jgi:hypothetical protein